MSTGPNYEELLDTIVRPLLTLPDEFEVRSKRHKNAVMLEFKTSADDVGRVIGRGGATIRSIRSLLEFAGEAVDDRISVELLEG